MKKIYFLIAIILVAIVIAFAQQQQPTLQEAFKQIKTLQGQVASLQTSLTTQKSYASGLETQIDNLETTSENQRRELRQQINEGLLRSLPVGSIVAYALDTKNIPGGWVPCDGRTISDASSIYNNYRVPDLRSYFIRGKGSNESLLAEGGANSHLHSIQGHKHEVGSHTHTFNTGYTSISNGGSCESGVSCRQPPGERQYILFSNSEYGFSQLTSHRHSGTTDNASKGYTAEAGGGYSGSESNIPKYIALNYIIKIK